MAMVPQAVQAVAQPMMAEVEERELLVKEIWAVPTLVISALAVLVAAVAVLAVRALMQLVWAGMVSAALAELDYKVQSRALQFSMLAEAVALEVEKGQLGHRA